MSVRPIAIAAVLTLLGACAAPTEPTAAKPSNVIELAAANSGMVAPLSKQNRRASEENCNFSRGVTTCVSTVQYTETTSHSEISGCRYGPNGVTGVRTRTFSDTYVVTVTTTTYRRGKSNKVFDSRTETSRQLVSSTQTSDTCQPL